MRQERERKRDEISENRRQIGSRSHDRSSSFVDLWRKRTGSDGSDTTGKMEYTKVVTTDGHTYAPKTSFSFTLTPVDHSKDTTQATFEGNVVLSGVEGGLTLKAGTNHVHAVRKQTGRFLQR